MRSRKHRVYTNVNFALAVSVLAAFSVPAGAQNKPNIILVYADDISARELPIYESSVWSKPDRGDTSDPALRAKTPVLDKMAKEGCWVKTAWASVVCSPSRAMMMTGRYAHLHKWWNNKDKGRYIDQNGKPAKNWPLYMSSPTLIGHVAQQAGYGTYWAGKTQMSGDLQRFGFDQGCFTPGSLSDRDNPFTDFKLHYKKQDPTRTLFNLDTDQPVDTYQQHGWYFYPHVRLMNHGDHDFQWWPNTPQSKEKFGVGTYGPDVELDFIFDFMDRQHEKGEPFFVYHTTHLGHDAFDWIDPESQSSWPGTPVIQWDGQRYQRTEPNITGDQGVYDTHGTVTEPGMHSHVEYLDYQMWLYRNKLEQMGIADNTVVIFCADNGSGGYGKNSSDRQKGTHVPLIIYAPGMTKQGAQDVLVNMSDMLPTIAELTGADLPSDYEINGVSLVPFLFTDQPKHRDWIYAYSRSHQFIRGQKVMKDGFNKWWDVSSEPEDLISFRQITHWESEAAELRAERDQLQAVLPRFDLHASEHDAPGVDLPSLENLKKKKAPKAPKAKKAERKKLALAGNSKQDERLILFRDQYDQGASLNKHYIVKPGFKDAWEIVDGVLIGKQTNDNHGAVIRKQLPFDDVDVSFDFRFDGAKGFNFVIDDQNEPTVHSGHICRVSVWKTGLRISDDKTGGMNLEVRKRRQNKQRSGEDTAKLEELLAATQSGAKVAIKPKLWHNLRVRIKGDLMQAFFDGELVADLQSPGFDHPTKTKFGFTVRGAKVEFDNLKVTSVQ